MGLDNGICVKRNTYSENVAELKVFQLAFDNDDTLDFEVCYWRKCWNVRADILDALKICDNEPAYSVPLDQDDICGIIELLKSYSEETWDIYESIWTWEEHEEFNERHIQYLHHLALLMEKYPDLEVYFYDSY